MFVHRGGLPPIGDADLAPGSYCALAGWAALLNWMMFGRAARCCWGADWGWALLTGMLGGAWAPLRDPGMGAGGGIAGVWPVGMRGLLFVVLFWRLGVLGLLPLRLLGYDVPRGRLRWARCCMIWI